MTQLTHTTLLIDTNQMIEPQCLVEVLEGSKPDQGTSIHLEQRRLSVGTGEQNDLRLRDTSVSRQHLEIFWTPQGYRLRDLNSKNGTVVGQLRVLDALLVGLTEIGLGKTLLRFTPMNQIVPIAPSADGRLGEMIGTSSTMRSLFGAILRCASKRTTVLLVGETGTGKEGLARALHDHSPWANGPFVPVNCAAIPQGLFESEFFGHVKGAFTGANQHRKGAFQEAHGGTLFLDEVGEIPLELQPKLLRALETQQVTPVGSNQTISVDVRIVSATNRNLFEEVELGQFRSDLYYRLAVAELPVPPLRERRDDIAPLCELFLQMFQQENMEPMLRQLHSETLQTLLQYEWPGNVRELRNVLFGAASLTNETVLHKYHLPARIQNQAPSGYLFSSEEQDIQPFKEEKSALLEQFERQYLQRLLDISEGNISQASRLSGINRKYLYQLLTRHDLK